MWVPSWLWSTEPALHPQQEEALGVYPTTKHKAQVDLEKAFDHDPRGEIWRVLQEYWVLHSRLLQTDKARIWWPVVSWIHLQ